jgi:hypothetical protein
MAVGIPLPSTLPQVPLVDGYQTTAQPNKVMFQPEVGEAKTRPRGTARGKPLACTFLYTTDEVAIFEAFFEEDLSDGNVRMAWTDPLRGDLADWKFDDQSPYSVTPRQGTLQWDMSWRLTRLP